VNRRRRTIPLPYRPSWRCCRRRIRGARFVVRILIGTQENERPVVVLQRLDSLRYGLLAQWSCSAPLPAARSTRTCVAVWTRRGRSPPCATLSALFAWSVFCRV